MIVRIISDSLNRGKWAKLLLTLIIALGSTVLTAMVMLSVDIGDQLNRELKSYGSNIRVIPREATLPARINGVDFSQDQNRVFLDENRIENIKLIFWAYNILNMAPALTFPVSIDGNDYTVTGTWFAKDLNLSSGESTVLGVNKLKEWWKLDGDPIIEGNVKDYAEAKAILGRKIANKLNLKPGSIFELETPEGPKSLTVSAVLKNRGEEDWSIYIPLDLAQEWGKLKDKVEWVEVSALTTPSNALDLKAREEPEALSSEEYDIWYCTAYIGSIIYQIEEVLPEASVIEIKQISKSEGNILKRMTSLMFLLSLAAVLCAAVGVSEMVVSMVDSRAKEVGLMKALGAEEKNIAGIFLIESLILAVVGSLLGFFVGGLVASIIAKSVFSVTMIWRPLVLPVSLFASVLITLLGSIAPLRTLLRLDPAMVLHR